MAVGGRPIVFLVQGFTSAGHHPCTWSKKRITLALLLYLKRTFDRENQKYFLKRTIQVGVAGNIARCVSSLLSDRRAMLAIDGTASVPVLA